MHTQYLATACLAPLLVIAPVAAQPLTPQRSVVGTTVISSRDPAVRVQLPPTAQYVGAHRWLLFGVADCEVHVFVEADAQRRVTRFYHVQFEAFIPSEPTATYDYASRRLEEVTTDGMTFYLKPNFGPSGDPAKPGSEQEQVWRLVREAGYVLPTELVNLRLVSVLDSARRKELLIYYYEDLAPTGFTTETLIADRAKRILAPEWAGIAASVRERALARISIRQP